MSAPTQTDLLAACHVFEPLLKGAIDNQELPIEVRAKAVNALVGILDLDVILCRERLSTIFS